MHTQRASAFVLGIGLLGAALAGAPAAVLAAPAGSGIRPMLADGSETTSGSAGPEAVIEPVEYGSGRRCAELRWACEYKEELGEIGAGNCRRYRAECIIGDGYCARLRRACQYKEFRDEVGAGHCRRYRNICLQ